MKNLLIGLLGLWSASAFASQEIPAHLLAEYKEAVASKIDSPQCQMTKQNGYFSLNGYGDSYAGANGNVFYFSDLVKDASRGEIDKTNGETTLTFYTVTKSQTIVAKVVQASCCSKEIGTYEITETFTKRVNEGTRDYPEVCEDRILSHDALVS